MILQFELAFRAENDDTPALIIVSLKNKMVASVVVVVSIVSSQWEQHNDVLQLEVALHNFTVSTTKEMMLKPV